MSRANVEALQRGLAAYDRRDVEALLEECHDDVEWESALVKGLGGETAVSSAPWPTSGTARQFGFAASSTGATPSKPPS